jgi:phosphate transport system protein
VRRLTRIQFHDQLKSLTTRLDDLARHANGMLTDGVKAFESLDRELADDVDRRKEELAELDEEIEHNALRLLALQQPMAKDLRRIGATLKLITYLTRVGRYGRDIARVTVRWPAGQGHVLNLVDLPRMAALALEMLDEVFHAFREQRAPDIEKIERIESEVDNMRRRVWDSCLVAMLSSPQNIEPCAHYMMVARYLERCGDNACKMAEKLHYVATGERVHVG